MAQSSFSQTLDKLEDTLDEYFGKKAPQMPEGLKEFLVKIAPYLTIIGLIFTIPGVLFLLGMGGLASVLAPFGGAEAVVSTTGLWLSAILTIPVIILEIMAIPGLFSMSKKGWRYVYWACLVSLVTSLVQFNILNLIIGGAISFYVLFQLKNKYS